MIDDEKKELLKAQIVEWRAIGLKCNETAEKHRAQGQTTEAERQAAFAYARNSCAQQLENLTRAMFP